MLKVVGVYKTEQEAVEQRNDIKDEHENGTFIVVGPYETIEEKQDNEQIIQHFLDQSDNSSFSQNLSGKERLIFLGVSHEEAEHYGSHLETGEFLLLEE
ncbi:hypothetical protein GA0061096_2254 [Fictibacillus enclensis]|uniref:Uncharacterized protein n=1 Tax=Fictibacillus enclensis TaxID=1017270 RepID=A0A0V8J7F6_9BACL|nr:hypothetical protein [Fictibacillus enclensis]KSU83055.1 hypothetical protein AS030_10720 [Fictibacillus enclensis]SCC09418.1 hypothetical protein GA0061096_2254 [Fictibacillus enclensis]